MATDIVVNLAESARVAVNADAFIWLPTKGATVCAWGGGGGGGEGELDGNSPQKHSEPQ